MAHAIERTPERKHFDALGNNPIARAEHDLAEIIRADKLLTGHRVEVLEQNSRSLSSLLKRAINEVRGVVILVGCDSVSNNPPVLEVEMTVSATENVVLNRVNPNGVTALDAIMRIVELIDGDDWCMQQVTQETPAEGVLTATATFRGQVFRTTPIDDASDITS